MHALSQRQAQVLDFVVSEIVEGRSPTRTEIAEEFGIATETATGHVAALIQKGWLRRGGRCSGGRAIEATELAWRRALAAEEKRAGRAAGGVSARTAVTLRAVARGVSPEKRLALVEFALC